MASRRRQEGGKQQHAEGMHGDLTHAAIQEQLKHKLPQPADPELRESGGAEESTPLKTHVPHPDGRHRLVEHRQQHDEADKNSEKNRLARKTKSTSGENK